MESRRPKSTNQQEKGLLDKGMDLLNRVVSNEEDEVKRFLESSPNYKNLINILEQHKSSKSRKGVYFGGNSIFQQVLYQVSDSEEILINNLKDAKNFAELFHKISVNEKVLDNPYILSGLGAAGIISQQANTGSSLVSLAREIREFANRNFYSLEPVHDHYRHGF